MITIATFCSCSDGDQRAPAPSAHAGAGARAGGAAGEGGAAGAESPAGGGPAMNAGADAGPGSVGVAGQDSSGGASAGAGPEASGGAGADAGEQLTFCARFDIPSPSQDAFNVSRDYDHTVYADCRVSWVINLYLVPHERDTFLNNLLSWNYGLWGCLGAPAVNDFALIYGKAPLTSADASALIDDYMVVAIADLKLSAQESHDLRAALVRLSQQTIAQDSTDFSHSSCDTGGTGGTSGGTGGTDGTGGTSGGTGGTDGGSGGSGGQAASAGAADVSAGAGGSNP
jgi:hypothetical protein